MASRTCPAFTRVLGALIAGVALPALAATFAGVSVPPPPAPKPQTDTFFDVKVDDPYRFLEQVNDAEVQSWMRGQADATTAILAKLPGRAELLTRIREVEAAVPGAVSTIERTEGGRLFFQRRNPGEEQFKLVMRDGADGAETVLFDPEALTKSTGKPHAIMDFTPSRDGKRLAYAMQIGGGEIGTLHVIDVASGKALIEPIDRIRYGNVAWLPDGSGFFYSRLQAGYEQKAREHRFDDRTRHFRALDAAGTDRAVMSPSRNPELKLPAYASGVIAPIPGTKLAALVVYLGVERNQLLYVADLDATVRGNAKWRQLVRVEDQVSDITFGGNYVYLRSSKGAPRFQILRMPLEGADIARAEVVVAPGESVIANIVAARDALYFTRRDGATLSLWRVPHAVGIDVLQVPLPFAGNVEIAAADRRDDGVVLQLGGWTRATKPFIYDTRSRSVKPLALARPGDFDAPDTIEAREVMVPSFDGVKVPVSILSRRGVKLDGSNPTIVYGYGAYGITESPLFNARIYAWVERGGVFAVAHVRGGGAFGDAWHQAGRKATKPNTWKDAIAAAEWLVKEGYTSPPRLAVYGGSAGGILVGRAITERPDLFAAAVPVVGAMDTIRAETTSNGPANIPEFGTVTKKDEFAGLLAMSSYHQVKDGAKYPAVMLVHGVNDIRVDVWESSKFGARLATASTSGKPVLMRFEYDSGHGQGSTRAQLQERAADIWSFMLWQMGEPAFQPK